ncbi:unnamed protein product [Camellia sinensis]
MPTMGSPRIVATSSNVIVISPTVKWKVFVSDCHLSIKLDTTILLTKRYVQRANCASPHISTMFTNVALFPCSHHGHERILDE